MSLHPIYDSKHHNRAGLIELGKDAAIRADIVEHLETCRAKIATCIQDLSDKDSTTLDHLDDILSDARTFRDEERRKYEAEMEKM